jgi:hypothetical protein
MKLEMAYLPSIISFFKARVAVFSNFRFTDSGDDDKLVPEILNTMLFRVQNDVV